MCPTSSIPCIRSVKTSNTLICHSNNYMYLSSSGWNMFKNSIGHCSSIMFIHDVFKDNAKAANGCVCFCRFPSRSFTAAAAQWQQFHLGGLWWLPLITTEVSITPITVGIMGKICQSLAVGKNKTPNTFAHTPVTSVFPNQRDFSRMK